MWCVVDPTLRILAALLMLSLVGCSRRGALYYLHQGQVEQKVFSDTLNFDLKYDLIFFPVDVDRVGERLCFLDSGAATSVLEQSLVMDRPVYRKIRTRDARNETRRGQLIEAPTLRVGDVEFRDLIALTQDFSNFPVEQSDFGGIVGQNVLTKAYWTVDFPKNKIYINSALPPSTANMLSLPLRAGDNGLPYVALRIGNETVEALLDLGAGADIMLPTDHPVSKALLRDYPYKTFKIDRYTLHGQREMLRYEILLPSVVLGDQLTLRNVYIAIEEGVDIAIGTRPFFPYQITLDYFNQRLHVYGSTGD